MGRARARAIRVLEFGLERAMRVGLSRGVQVALGATLIHAANEVMRHEVNQAVAAVLSSPMGTAAMRTIGDFAHERWPEQWRRALAGPLSVVMQQATKDTAPVFGSFELSNPKIQAQFDRYVDRLTGALAQTSRDNCMRVIQEAMDEGMDVPTTARHLADRMPEVNQPRATLIARTELTTAANGASLIQAQESGLVAGKRWIATHDERTRPTHRILHDEVVAIAAPFSNGLQFPSEPNCRCSLGWVFDEDEIPTPFVPREGVEKVRDQYGDDTEPEPETGPSQDEARARQRLEAQYGSTWDRLTPDQQQMVIDRELRIMGGEGQEPVVEEGWTPEQVRDVIKGVEDELWDLPKEKGVVVSKAGRVTMSKDGKKSSVSFTPQELEDMRGKVFTHNHPHGRNFPATDPRHQGNSFSPQDIILAAKTGLEEVRAVTPVWRYSMQPPEGVRWSAGWAEDVDLAGALSRADRDTWSQTFDDMDAGNLTNEEAEAGHWHKVMQRLAEATGMRYSRERRESGSEQETEGDGGAGDEG